METSKLINLKPMNLNTLNLGGESMLKSANKVISIILMIISIVYIIASFRLPNYPYIPVDSDAVPITLGFILLFLSILLFFSKDNHDKDQKIPKDDIKAILTVLAFLLAYIFLLEILGFLLSTALFLFINSLYLGHKKWISNLIVSIAIPLSIYLLFTRFLEIVLPKGILPF